MFFCFVFVIFFFDVFVFYFLFLVFFILFGYFFMCFVFFGVFWCFLVVLILLLDSSRFSASDALIFVENYCFRTILGPF